MKKIDTEYKSLSEIDPEIVRFYSEDIRTRVTGHTEPDEEGNTSPITEQYVVIVLNQPNEVSYEYVESRRGRRFGEDVVRGALVQAMVWEDFAVNHNGYLAWKAEYLAWEEKQPTELIDGEEVLAPAPLREVLDLGNRQEFYSVKLGEYAPKIETLVGYERTYNDEDLTALDTPITEPRDPASIVAENEDLAIETRFNEVYAELPVGEHYIDIGKGKDGIFGISNVTSAINAYDAGLTDMSVVNWIMTDNEVVPMTIEDLKQVIVDFSVRKQEVFTKYAIWRAGDRLTPFSVN